MSERPLSISFFDPARELYGIARAGTTLLFEDGRPSSVASGLVTDERGGRVRARLEDRLELELEPLSDEAELAGVAVRICRARGEVAGGKVDCLGTVAETRAAPAWEELDALRSLVVLVDERHGLLALARRPRGALGHGQERVTAWLLSEGELKSVEETRISTVYDGDGRQRSAGLELWLPGEDFPRRGSGTVVAGSSLELEGLLVQAAVFRWRLEEREGIGSYEIVTRSERPTAA